MTAVWDLSWMGAAALGAAWVVTEAAREVAADIDTAMRRARLSRKAAAADMGLTEAKLSEALACKTPLNIFRLASLGPAFWLAFDEVRAERTGRLLFERSLIALVVHHKKPMARMALAEQDKEGVA